MSSDWIRYIDESSGYPYYYSSSTGESRWATEEELSYPFPQQQQQQQFDTRYSMTSMTGSSSSRSGSKIGSNERQQDSQTRYVERRPEYMSRNSNNDNNNTNMPVVGGFSGQSDDLTTGRSDQYSTARSGHSSTGRSEYSVSSQFSTSVRNYAPGNPYATTGVGSRDDISDDSDGYGETAAVDEDEEDEEEEEEFDDEEENEEDEDDDDDDEENDDEEDGDDDEEEEDDDDDDDDDSYSASDDSGEDIEASYVDNEGAFDQSAENPTSALTEQPAQQQRPVRVKRKDDAMSPDMEMEFKDFLASVEGKAMMAMEQKRVEKMLEKEQVRERRRQERKRRYEQRLLKKGKGEVKGPPTMVTIAGAAVASVWVPATTLLSAAWLRLQSFGKKKRKKQRQLRTKGGKAGIDGLGEDDIEGGGSLGADTATHAETLLRPPSTASIAQRRPTKPTKDSSASRRRRNESGSDWRGAVTTGATATSGVSSDDDTSDSDESFSSDDSDVLVIKAPLLPAWASWAGLRAYTGALLAEATILGLPPRQRASPPPLTAGRLLQIASLGSVVVAKSVGSTSARTLQWTLERAGPYVTSTAGYWWGAVNRTVRRYAGVRVVGGGGRARKRASAGAGAGESEREGKKMGASDSGDGE